MRVMDLPLGQQREGGRRPAPGATLTLLSAAGPRRSVGINKR